MNHKLAVGLIFLAACASCGTTQPVTPQRTTSQQAAYTTCAPNRAASYPDGRNGVAIYVNAPGPDVVNVDILDSWGRHHHLRQQVATNKLGSCQIQTVRRRWAASTSPAAGARNHSPTPPLIESSA